MGAIVAESRHSEEVAGVFGPVGDMFAALFFVSIGMLIDVRLVQQFIVPALIVAAVFMMGKVIADSQGSFASGAGGRTSLRVGMGMPQMGEFSLTFAKVGRDSGAVTAVLYPVIVLAAAITTVASPYISRFSETIINWLERVVPQTLAEYLTQMDQWLKAVWRGVRGERETAVAARGHGRTILANVFIIAVFLGSGTIALQFVDRLARIVHIRSDLLGMGVGFIVLLVTFPSLMAIWRALRRMVREVATRIPLRSRRGRRWRPEVARAILLDSIGILLLIVLIVIALPFVMGLLRLQSLALMVPLMMLVAVGYFLWGAVSRVHSRVEAMFCRTLTGDEDGCSVEEPEVGTGRKQ
jgi:CPA2 family monovalent cation:H+ antiporter-2